MTKESPCFFLGANGPKGFYSKFDQLFNYKEGCRCVLLKGGPGTGKSTVLKKTAAVLNQKGLSTELIYCTADTDSLDAVITEDGRFCALDATLPHAVEPKYPGAYEETLNLSDCWNSGVLKEKTEKIIYLFDRNRALHAKARKYIAAAGELLEEAAQLSLETLIPEKIAHTAGRICAKEFGKKRRFPGKEKLRFLSAITDKGVFVFENTPKLICDKIYVLEDDCGAASRIFMNTVRRIALDHGLDIITCRCGIFPGEKNEHIFIPELRLGFMTSNRRHPVTAQPYRVIHARRFIDGKQAGLHKLRIKFSLRTAAELIREAADCMREAKIVHDSLEREYSAAMDFDFLNKKTESFLSTV